jgi:hypothetical protein
MRTHREFCQDVVGPMADVVFVGCCVTDAAEPPLPSGGGSPRRQVILDDNACKLLRITS